MSQPCRYSLVTDASSSPFGIKAVSRVSQVGMDSSPHHFVRYAYLPRLSLGSAWVPMWALRKRARSICLPYVSRRYGELYTLVWTLVPLKGLVHRPIRRFFDQGYHAWSLWTFSMRHSSSRGSHWSLGYRLEVFLVSYSFPWVTGTPSASLHDHHMVFGLGKNPYWRYLSRRKSKMQTLVQEISRDIDVELITPFEPYRRGD